MSITSIIPPLEMSVKTLKAWILKKGNSSLAVIYIPFYATSNKITYSKKYNLETLKSWPQ